MSRHPGLLSLAALLALACGQPEPTTAPSAPPVAPAPAEPPSPEQPPEPTCDERYAAAAARAERLDPSAGACTFDHECVAVPFETECGALCPVAVHTARRDAVPAPEGDCGACPTRTAECARSTPRCNDGRCRMDEGDAPLREVPIPEQNRAGQDPAPPRPAPGDPEQDRARRLLAAIHADDPSLAQDFFFPREAFARVKAIRDPDAYWQRLYARFATDVHALHESLGPFESAPELLGLDIIRRGGWVPRGEEGNALPYWVSRHSQLRYRVGGEERRFEVRVLITWGERWYITHLSEFH